MYRVYGGGGGDYGDHTARRQHQDDGGPGCVDRVGQQVFAVLHDQPIARDGRKTAGLRVQGAAALAPAHRFPHVLVEVQVVVAGQRRGGTGVVVGHVRRRAGGLAGHLGRRDVAVLLLLVEVLQSVVDPSAGPAADDR